MAEGTDGDAADDVDKGNGKPRDRVAAHEFCRTIHRTEEVAFVLQRFAAFARLVFVDQPRRQIGVDCHLLAGHGIQGKPGGDFGDASRTFGDDHEIDQSQNRENDDADDEIAPHHKAGERLDHMSRRVRSLVAMSQNQTRGAKVQRKPDQRRQKQNRRGAA